MTDFSPRIRIAFVAIAMFSLAVIVLPHAIQAQTFIKLHDFSGPEGKLPIGTLAVDTTGNLYGTAEAGGFNEHGTVFKLTKHNSTWVLTTLYRFTGGSDGSGPSSGVMLAPDGTLYGTTAVGGGSGCYGYGCGTVFRLTPPIKPCAAIACPLMETVLYRFTGGDDGSEPYGKVTFGSDGGLYGTTTGYPWGGPPAAKPQLPFGQHPSFMCNSGFGGNCGNVYKLTRSGSGWTESVLWSFNTTDGDDATHPYSEVIFDQSGNLYGTTFGDDGESVVYQLAPSGSSWTETAICRLDVEPIYSKNASAGLIFDGSGDLVGATSLGFIPPSGGVPFMVHPAGGCDWFGQQLSWGGPYDSLIMDAAGNFYGTEQWGGSNTGDVFELRWNQQHGWYDYVVLHTFGSSDGYRPLSGLVFGPDGNLYGATNAGGNYGWGVIFEIIP